MIVWLCPAGAILPQTLQVLLIAVITVDVLVGDIPIGVRRDVITETTELLFNRLVLLLTRR